MDSGPLFQGYFYGVVPSFPTPSQSQQDFTSPAHPWTPSVASSFRLPKPLLFSLSDQSLSVCILCGLDLHSKHPFPPFLDLLGHPVLLILSVFMLYSTQLVHMVVRPLGCRHTMFLTQENTVLSFHYCLLAHLLSAPILPPTRPPCVLPLLPQAYALAVLSPKHFASLSL